MKFKASVLNLSVFQLVVLRTLRRGKSCEQNVRLKRFRSLWQPNHFKQFLLLLNVLFEVYTGIHM